MKRGKRKETEEGEGKGEAEKSGRGRELVENKFQTLLSKITGSSPVNKLKVLISSLDEPQLLVKFP